MKTVISTMLLFCPLALLAQDRPSGIDTSGFENNVRFQDDLFLAVNGSWLSATEIPADKSNYGSFTILADQSQERIRDLIESIDPTNHFGGSEEQKIGDFYNSFMNEDRIEEVGLDPIKDLLEVIDAIDNQENLVTAFGRLRRSGVQTPIAFFVDQDDKNATEYLAGIFQSGTTLPERDYYLLDEEKYVAARSALEQYVQTMLVAADVADPETMAAAVVDLETSLAKVQWPRVELRDPEKRYNKYAVSDLGKLGDHLDYPSYFAALEIPAIESINVTTPSFFEGLDSILVETPLDTWKAYLKYKTLDSFAPYLFSELDQAHFQMHQTALTGVTEQQPRWRRAVNTVAGEGAGDFGALGDAVGRMYVEKYFPPEYKERMDRLVGNLLKAFEQSIDDLTWMTDETKQRAQEKLAKITTKIGYTKKWRDYHELWVKPDDLVGNVRRSNLVEFERMTGKLGQPIDREEWGMTPQTVNAYYNPSKNEIVFPAAILQPPFFNPDADDAVNYGGIGAVIGHEISHAFDDQGSKYDGDGNLNNWWTEADAAAFKELTDRLVAQYDAYEPLPGKNVNGRFTLGENIADLSGLSIAHKAYRLSLDGKPAPEMDGFTGDQRFFIGWSQVWRRKYRDDEMVRRLVVDPHSPSYFRANGPVVNIDAFYQAFAVGPEDALFKPENERIRIW